MTDIDYDIEFQHIDTKNVINWENTHTVKLFNNVSIGMNDLYHVTIPETIELADYERVFRDILGSNKYPDTFKDELIIHCDNSENSNFLYAGCDNYKYTTYLRHIFSNYLTSHYDNESWGVWLVAKGKYAGTLPKRLNSLCYKEFGLHLPANILSEFGQAMGKVNQTKGEYWIQFLDGIDWNRGAFGDDGSCFWGDREGAKEMMSSVGALAVKIWSSVQSGGGDNHNNYNSNRLTIEYDNNWLYSNSRFWMIPHSKGLACFNGYGMELIRSIRLVSTLLGVSYYKVSIENNDSTDNTLYINSGSGYLLGEYDRITKVNSIDFRIDDIENRGSCDRCGGDYNTDDITYVNGCNYCEECLNECYTSCEYCNEYVDNGNVYELDGEYYCESCFNRRGYVCGKCGEHFNKDDNPAETLHYGDHSDGCQGSYDENVCPDCIENDGYYCEQCESYWNTEECDLTPVEVESGEVNNEC